MVCSEIVCLDCGKKEVVYHSVSNGPPLICSECQTSREATDAQAHIDQLKKLPIEERIERIERWIYNYRSPRHIHDDLIG